MKSILTVLAATFLFALPAAAQGPVGLGASHAGIGYISEEKPWQISFSYQYNAVNLTGKGFETSGGNITVTRFFKSWFGVEGQFGAGAGNTGTTTNPPNLNVKSLLLVGGGRLALRGHGRLEPWIHADVGLLHFKMNQTAGVLGSNSSFEYQGGGGLDLDITENLALRTEGDIMETRFFGAGQRDIQVLGSVVFNLNFGPLK